MTKHDEIVAPSPANAGQATQSSPGRASTPVTEIQGRPLSVVRAGEKVRLVRVNAGRGLNSRLAAMGFVPNVGITVVSNSHPGPFVIVVKDAKVMLGRGVAHKIIVK